MSRTRLTREGWYYLILLLCIAVNGSIKQVNLMLVIAGMMVGALYFNWHGVRSMLRKLRIRRRLPESVEAGETLVVELLAASPITCMAVIVEDAIRAQADAHRNGQPHGLVAFPRIAGGQTTRGEYRVVFDERGQYEFGPLWATTRHPFGLVSRRVRLTEKSRLLVLPRLGRMTARWSRRAQAVDYGSHRPVRRPGVAEGDFFGLRDWQAGDSRRLIHWRTSARRGGLMVRQFEQPQNESLTLLVELWQPETLKSEHAVERERIELAIRFAATAVVEACRRGGSSLTVITAGRKIETFAGGGSKALARDILRHLALVAAGSDDRRAELLERGAEARKAGGRVVLVTTRPESPAGNGDAGSARMLCLSAGSEEFFQYFQADSRTK